VYNPVSAFSLMSLPPSRSAGSATLERRIGLRSAVLFNMLEMIGVGPFITLPLVIAAAGFQMSVWAWVVGAVIAIADGLVWAELGAAFPRAGGSYAFLREIYGPDRAGNWLSFLYVWQLSFSAPLSIASGCIGLSSFLGMFWPGLDRTPMAAFPMLHYSNFAAAVACLLMTWLLYRNLPLDRAFATELVLAYPVLFTGAWLWLRRHVGTAPAAGLCLVKSLTFYRARTSRKKVCAVV